jgi:crotonobetainyl-CoA:carnitine CoA-transferase CaiB-like acyl-CoA transferase
VKHRELVDEAVGGWLRRRSLADAISYFEEAGVTAAPVYDIAQFKDDPHVQERGILIDLPDDEMGTVPMHAVVPRLDGTPGVIRTPAPEIGQHNDEIYAGIGYSPDRIRSLHESGII